MNIPDKVSYTIKEKIGEAVAAVLTAAVVVSVLLLFISGTTDSGIVIMIPVSVILYGALSIATVYPQGTNLIDKPEKANDSYFHKVRRGCITAKIVFQAVSAVLCVILVII